MGARDLYSGHYGHVIRSKANVLEEPPRSDCKVPKLFPKKEFLRTKPLQPGEQTLSGF